MERQARHTRELSAGGLGAQVGEAGLLGFGRLSFKRPDLCSIDSPLQRLTRGRLGNAPNQTGRRKGRGAFNDRLKRHGAERTRDLLRIERFFTCPPTLGGESPQISEKVGHLGRRVSVSCRPAGMADTMLGFCCFGSSSKGCGLFSAAEVVISTSELT